MTQPDAPPAGETRPRILVVDDEENVIQILQDLLSENPYDVDTVPTGEEALEVFGDAGGHAGSNETGYVQAIVPEHVHPERYEKEMAAPNAPENALFVVPSPASIGLYEDGKGYPTFDPGQAKLYFEKVNDKVATVIEATISRWDRAGLYE